MQEEQPESQPHEAGWQFSPEGASGVTEVPSHGDEAVSWTASEFIAHEKGLSWYAILGVVAAIMMILAYLMTRDKTSVGMILVVLVVFAIFSARKPRTLPYRVDNSGIHVGEKSYGYELFKSFAVIQEGGVHSIMMMPMKRFMPPLSIYMDPADEHKIVDVLAVYLPAETRGQDVVDRLMRRLRF